MFRYVDVCILGLFVWFIFSSNSILRIYIGTTTVVCFHDYIIYSVIIVLIIVWIIGLHIYIYIQCVYIYICICEGIFLIIYMFNWIWPTRIAWVDWARNKRICLCSVWVADISWKLSTQSNWFGWWLFEMEAR